MIVVVGSTTADFFMSGVEHIPRIGGDEFHADNLTFCDQPLRSVLGGNGANTTYVLAKLGAQASLSSAIGNDQAGDLVSGWLAEQNVNLAGLKRSATHATATNTIITDTALNRISFYHSGACDSFGVEDIPPELLQTADVVLVSSYTLLPQLRSKGYASILAAARQAGAVTALDIGPAIGQPVQLAELRPLLPRIDYLITNDYELSVCTNCQDVESGVARLLEAGATYVVVKQGKEGSLIRGETIDLNEAGFAVNARFTVGAGDSFNAGFLYGLAQGWALQPAARFANATAALVVSSGQGILGCPSLAQVETFLA